MKNTHKIKINILDKEVHLNTGKTIVVSNLENIIDAIYIGNYVFEEILDVQNSVFVSFGIKQGMFVYDPQANFKKVFIKNTSFYDNIKKYKITNKKLILWFKNRRLRANDSKRNIISIK